MYTKDQLNDLYERTAKAIDISDELFDAADEEYNKLGKWIDKETPEYKITIYPQGSFALGTVIKPFDESEDYDLDLVCEFKQPYGLTPRELKNEVVKPLLEDYRNVKGEIQEKRRCWHVEYEDFPQFHMDIVPAVNRTSYIDITDHDEEIDFYEYIGSNPSAYAEWFKSRKAKRRTALVEQYCTEHRNLVTCQADIEQLKEYNFKTPLQKAIQILKRHRNIMFLKDENNCLPVSIIISTIAAELYNNEDNIVDTLVNILGKAEAYILSHKVGTKYHVDNPCYTGGDTENFADKWNEYPERAAAFFNWIRKAKMDLIDQRLYGLIRVQMAENIKLALGEKTGTRVFSDMAKEEEQAILAQQAKVNTATGVISSSGTVPVQLNHNHGEVS